ncbi:uncharacterized protein EV154DRAFT_427967 [Mucor mucedo]|uniref:uncharacterized protein n=1 Tax=Mucor mucedo TaxID=29922 RepID=UPI00222030FB|nr:uncharacterized protein EV154DRAFT_427967 [Mucor mucedo]KAI7884485.1 hypothetical protein EV154DRAFT_427967 [Mucor mucedo]
MQLAEYLEIIPRMTNTDCVLLGRCIRITGEESCVDNAIDKFRVIQNSHVSFTTSVDYAMCIHYPKHSGHYGLCFCDLNRYKQKEFVIDQLDPHQVLEDIYVMLPVFIDPLTNEYARPKDLIQIKAPAQKKYQQMAEEEYRERDKLKRKEINDAFAMLNVKPEPLSVYEYEVQKLPENTEENFPSLSPSPVSRSPTPINGRRPKGLFKPTLGNEEPKKNRVIRIVPQKSYRSRSPTPSLSLVERVKEYNYHNIKNVLEKGLDSIRGFKGEIRLSAKIGKVFWTDVPAEIKGQIWRYEDINDILIKEHNLKPQFTRATARDQFILECMTSENILPSPAYNKTSTYEFHCLARNQPIVPFRPVVIHMNEGVINVKKVVLREKVVSKVDWVSLDRKYDFELSLSTKVLARTDVKPYSTFIKRVSICPITCLMTFENVPKFLSVEFLLLKVTARFRIDHPFIIEITRVEKVPIKPVAGTVKIDAYPGEGEFWYDFEIRNTETDVSFEKNKDLEIGDEAPWTAKDILDLADGDHAKADNITKHVQNILNVIEKIEREIRGT